MDPICHFVADREVPPHKQVEEHHHRECRKLQRSSIKPKCRMECKRDINESDEASCSPQSNRCNKKILQVMCKNGNLFLSEIDPCFEALYPRVMWTWKRRNLAVFEDGGVISFNEEELKNIQGYETGTGYIEVFCGCTNKKYGDFIGKLRINVKGQFSVTCECFPGCSTVNVTLVEFEKHAGIQGNGKWKSNIWVHTKEEDRVPLWRTHLFKYYTHQANVSNWIDAANRKRTCHRDEFIRCSSCEKERRFRLRTRQQIGDYHAALINKMWKCSDWPYQKITCNDAQERLGFRPSRGCTRASGCQGCTTCYCGGCIMCRFENCSCQECRDFMLFAEP